MGSYKVGRDIMRRRITAWAAWDRNERGFVHHHIEDGWAAGFTPRPIKPGFIDQAKAWPKQKWVKSYGYLDKDSKVCLIYKNISPASIT